MTAWWSGRAVLFDLETDDKEPTDARIITACLAYVNPGHETEVDTWLVKPERPIPAEATAIHGIGTEYAEYQGQDREGAIDEIACGLDSLHRSATRVEWTDAPLIGHNIRYDLTVLDREMRRTGVGSLGHERGMVTVRVDGRQVGAFHVIDTLVLDKWVDPYRKGRRTLDATATHYNVPIKGDAHTAEADALAAGRVAWAIAKRCGMDTADLWTLYRDRRDPYIIASEFHRLEEMTLPDLHRNQSQWAAEQAAGLREYFARNPDKGDPLRVSDAWPLEPVGTVDAVTDLV